MADKLAIIGSTGLIGLHFLESVRASDYESVTAITRRPIPSIESKSFITQAIHNFKDLEDMRSDLKVDTLVCSLGTTIKTAGSQEVFRQVDHEIPLRIAEIALEEGCQRMILVSAVGANANSSVFYSRVKGQLEEDLTELGYKYLYILQPSMLLGDRREKRTGETLGKILMKPLSFVTPWKYKPIHANTMAAAIHRAAASDLTGKHIWVGKTLFDVI